MPPKRKLSITNDPKQRKLFAFLPVPATEKDAVESAISEQQDEVSAVETESRKTEQGPEVSAASRPTTTKTESESSRQVITRTYQPSWEKIFSPWLFYEEGRGMLCRICIAAKRNNSFTTGCTNYRKSAPSDHAKIEDHRLALQVPKLQKEQADAQLRLLSGEEAAMASTTKLVYWMIQESLPLSKFPSLLALVKDLGAPNVDKLNVSDTVTYEHRNTATQLMQVMSNVISENIVEKIKGATYITILADESTDRANNKRLALYIKLVDSQIHASTHFLTNVSISDGTGETMAEVVLQQLEAFGLETDNIGKLMGLGTDGATAMVGKGKGLHGRMLRVNPHIVNIHCIAHRLALCTSQAASGVPAMESYVEILTSLFYYFKASPSRCQKLKDVQEIVDSPKLRFKEVHEVRWLSFYEALEAIYRSLEALLTYLEEAEAAARAKDPKAVGLKKKICTLKFIGLTSFLMDVIPAIGALNLFFQSQEVDIAMIKVKLDRCKEHLRQLKTDGGEHLKKFWGNVSHDSGKTQYCGHVVTGCPNSDITSAVDKFVDNLITNIDGRFPNTDLLTAFGILCMRPVSFLSEREIDRWGIEQLETLLDHYGAPKTHSWDDDNGQKQHKTSPPLVDKDATRREWKDLKETVKAQMFPRDNTAALWKLIAISDTAMAFPNMRKLGQLALTLPVHTADVERGFSRQNLLCTSLRNRLSPEFQDCMLRVQLEGPDQVKGQHPFVLGVVDKWAADKKRVLFSARRGTTGQQDSGTPSTSAE